MTIQAGMDAICIYTNKYDKNKKYLNHERNKNKNRKQKMEVKSNECIHFGIIHLSIVIYIFIHLIKMTILRNLKLTTLNWYTL